MAANQCFHLQKLDLKIIILNISGLRTKTKFVKHILIKYKPDILCLQETNINDDYNRNKAIFELGADKNSSFLTIQIISQMAQQYFVFLKQLNVIMFFFMMKVELYFLTYHKTLLNLQ